MKKYLTITLLFLTAVCSAQTAADSLFMHVGDTLYYNDDFESCLKETATQFGIVKRINEQDNVATLNVFSMQNNRLTAIEKRVASGANYHDYKGLQKYYRSEGTVESARIYAMCREDADEKQTSVLTEETLYYPDGTVQETVKIHYSIPNMHDRYERTCYYPTGEKQYNEVCENKNYTEMYFKPDGKKANNPNMRFNHYIVMPEFPGGEKELFKFLSKEVKYPIECMEKGIIGRVVVEFTISKEGVISNIEIKESSGNALFDKESVRVIMAMPNWTPGTRRDKPIEFRLTVPINFHMQ